MATSSRRSKGIIFPLILSCFLLISLFLNVYYVTNTQRTSLVQEASSRKYIATLTVTPNPAAYYSSVTLTGCGYYPSTGTTIVMNSPQAISFFGGLSDANGCISISNNVNASGNYTIEAWQTVKNKAHIMAATTLTVQ